jgi:DNA-directed RNA polymerase subunit RPC12/RpoP
MTRYVCSRCGKIITEEESIEVGEDEQETEGRDSLADAYELICEQCHPSWKDENFESE